MQRENHSKQLEQSPIDAVITWVDGNDRGHVAKREAEIARHCNYSLTSIPGGRHRTRFADNGELRYCVYSIRQYCPWVRWIFLVTDQQRPPFLDEEECNRLGVRIVDHQEIFRGHECALPTFNSQSIESALHRIDGLAERFVYFNDDVIVLRPTDPQEFYCPVGVVLRGEWKPLPKFGKFRMALSSLANHIADKLLGKVRSMAVLAQYRAARLAGFDKRFLLAPHTPHPVRRGTIARFFAQHPELFEENIKYKFRDMAQFVTMPLANHIEIAAGTYTLSESHDYTLICFNRDSAAAIDAKLAVLANGTQRFLCLQGFENANPDQRRRVLDVLSGIGSAAE